MWRGYRRACCHSQVHAFVSAESHSDGLLSREHDLASHMFPAASAFLSSSLGTQIPGPTLDTPDPHVPPLRRFVQPSRSEKHCFICSACILYLDIQHHTHGTLPAASPGEVTGPSCYLGYGQTINRSSSQHTSGLFPSRVTAPGPLTDSGSRH